MSYSDLKWRKGPRRVVPVMVVKMTCFSQAIDWKSTSVDLSSLGSSDIRLWAFSKEIPQPSITMISLKNTSLKFDSNLPGVSQLIAYCYYFRFREPSQLQGTRHQGRHRRFPGRRSFIETRFLHHHQCSIINLFIIAMKLMGWVTLLAISGTKH